MVGPITSDHALMRRRSFSGDSKLSERRKDKTNFPMGCASRFFIVPRCFQQMRLRALSLRLRQRKVDSRLPPYEVYNPCSHDWYP